MHPLSGRGSDVFMFCENSRIFQNAKIAQLVEHNLAKVRVAGSSPVFRSLYRIHSCPDGGMVDTKDLKSFGFTAVRVQVPLRVLQIPLDRLIERDLRLNEVSQVISLNFSNDITAKFNLSSFCSSSVFSLPFPISVAAFLHLLLAVDFRVRFPVVLTCF